MTHDPSKEFYELNLRSLPLDQSQDETKVEIPLYKDIQLLGIMYVNSD